MDTSLLSDPYAVQKVRHPLKARLLQVRRVQRMGPYLVRVTLAGDELAGFVSASFDDHVKLFLPVADAPPVMPTIGPQGPVYPDDAPRPVTRDYTPRRYDANAGELDIDSCCMATAQRPPGRPRPNRGTTWAWRARAARSSSRMISIGTC